MFSPKLVTTRSEMIKKSLKEFLVSSVRLKTWLDVFSLISTLIRFSMVVYQLFEKKFAISMENEGLPVSCESTLTAIFIMTYECLPDLENPRDLVKNLGSPSICC